MSETSHAMLYYFDTPEATTALSMIDPKNEILSITTYTYSAKRKYGIEIESTKEGRRYWFMCKTERDQRDWINMLNACKDNPTVKVKTAHTRNRKDPPKKEVVEQETGPKHRYDTRSRVFSIQIQNGSVMSDMMQPWYMWALDIMSCGGRAKKAPYLALCSGNLKRRFFQLCRDRSMIRWGCSTVEFSSVNMSEKKQLCKTAYVAYHSVNDCEIVCTNGFGLEQMISAASLASWLF
jgi:hypothetical protein